MDTVNVVAVSVCCVYFERWRPVTPLIVYAKSEMDNITDSMKPGVNAAIDEIETHLEKLFSRGEDR